jgi:general secretion pathway protein E
LCPRCSAPGSPPGDEITAELAACAPAGLPEPAGWRRPAGCDDCLGTGYKGRLAIYEAIELIAPLREAILQRQPAHSLAKIARASGFRSLRQDGLLKAARGITSVDEVIRVTGLGTAD